MDSWTIKFGIKPGLERMAWMLKELGDPQDNFKAVHIVGTNGKGSTVNALQTIFTQAGYEVGTFTSPILLTSRNESLNGQMISEEDLLDLVNRVKPVVERLPKETEHENATEFEIITVLMFLYFGQVHPVDIAFIEAECGLMIRLISLSPWQSYVLRLVWTIRLFWKYPLKLQQKSWCFEEWGSLYLCD